MNSNEEHTYAASADSVPREMRSAAQHTFSNTKSNTRPYTTPNRLFASLSATDPVMPNIPVAMARAPKELNTVCHR